jgi:hypothetical protein
MFDFSRLSEMIGTATTNYLSGGQEPAQLLSELLESAGLDPSALAGLSESEISALLAEHGIDVSPLLEGGLQQALADLGIGNEVTHV